MLNSEKLIESVRRRASVPEDKATYDDPAILDIAYEEMAVGIIPTLLSVNEEHLVIQEEYDLVSGKKRYEIPYRSVANKLRDVCLVDDSGSLLELTRINPDSLSDYDENYSSAYDSSFYVQSNEIVFTRSPNLNYKKIRFYYYLRPSKLVLKSEVATITSLDTVTGTLTLNIIPDRFLENTKFDFISKKTPNKVITFDVEVTSISENTSTMIFFPLNANISVGDTVCIAEETNVPPIPIELHPLLAQRVAVHILESQGDTEGLRNSQERLANMERSVSQLLNDRIEGSPQKIRQRNTPLIQSLSNFNRFKRNR